MSPHAALALVVVLVKCVSTENVSSVDKCFSDHTINKSVRTQYDPIYFAKAAVNENKQKDIIKFK